MDSRQQDAHEMHAKLTASGIADDRVVHICCEVPPRVQVDLGDTSIATRIHVMSMAFDCVRRSMSRHHTTLVTMSLASALHKPAGLESFVHQVKAPTPLQYIRAMTSRPLFF